MHLSVVNEDADVTGVRTGERTLHHSFLDTLEDGWHKAQVDGTSDNAVVELQFSTPLQIGDFRGLDIELGLLAVNHELGLELSLCRANEQMHLTELSGTSGLLLVTVLSGCDLCDGLAVRNLRSKELDLKAELVVQTPLHDIDVLLSVTVENCLTELLGVLYHYGRVLCGNLLESISELLLVLLNLGLDGTAVLRSREGNLAVVKT